MFVATAGIRSDAFRFSAICWCCDLGCGFHGDNTGSNPVGDANKTKSLEKITLKSWLLGNIAHNWPCTQDLYARNTKLQSKGSFYAFS